jgi:putative endonuclease
MYVLRCSDNSYYCGISTDVSRRLKEHNESSKKGAKYTRSRKPCVLLYEESHPDRSRASKAESRFKKKTRKKKTQYLVDKVTERYEEEMRIYHSTSKDGSDI